MTPPIGKTPNKAFTTIGTKAVTAGLTGTVIHQKPIQTTAPTATRAPSSNRLAGNSAITNANSSGPRAI